MTQAIDGLHRARAATTEPGVLRAQPEATYERFRRSSLQPDPPGLVTTTRMAARPSTQPAATSAAPLVFELRKVYRFQLSLGCQSARAPLTGGAPDRLTARTAH